MKLLPPPMINWYQVDPKDPVGSRRRIEGYRWESFKISMIQSLNPKPMSPLRVQENYDRLKEILAEAS